MDGFVDLEEAIKAESKSRLDKVEKLAGLSALVLLSAAVWLAWPTLKSGIAGNSMNSDLMYALIIIAWGVFVQDLGIMDKKSRSRIGIIATVAWLPLAVVALSNFEGGISELIGMSILLIVSYALFATSREILQGDVAVMKFRSVMGVLGLVLSASLLTTVSFDDTSSYLQTGVCAVGLLLVLSDWFGNDDQRGLRKQFDVRLNKLEERILILRSQGAAVDQAASLIMTAREEGHREPEWGMRLLNEAEEDIERSLSLAGDVDEIKSDSLNSVEKAEEIAPIAKRPRKAWEMGQREVELGSLREGEALFRQAKQRANEIIEWWEKAEEAIREGAALLAASQHSQENLEEILADAKKKLNAEKPKKAYEFAMVIPDQIAASGDALVAAEAAVAEAAKQLKGADGINKSLLEERLESAEDALEQGNSSQAKGLADGIVREINAEREAMDDVRRALRQKVHLVSRWSDREDAKDWDDRLAEIESYADDLEWTHAATLLERLTKDVDAEGKASDEANELLEYVLDEWNVLRNQCDASGIKLDDDDRKSTEEAIALASEAHKAGRIDEALESLGLADGFMERLRRRV
ncbi:MAG: hypothetical protein CMB57_03825 [Euryarchaeota archaeon]|nr:hypothetical protein [Euryarchaeota archaeon]|tara:strand:- start:1546 stop:3291 length:1746 start_codon:yes stop_codon:yes gene_type:complete